MENEVTDQPIVLKCHPHLPSVELEERERHTFKLSVKTLCLTHWAAGDRQPWYVIIIISPRCRVVFKITKVTLEFGSTIKGTEKCHCVVRH